MRLVRLISCALCCSIAGLVLCATAGARVPQGFIGMNVGAPVLGQNVNGHQLDLMVAAGVENMRVAFYWGGAQPYATWSDVPASQQHNFEQGPVPTSYTATDPIVAAAAQRHLTLLPTVVGTPEWAASPHPSGTGGTPISDATYAAYMADLVGRYGPRGTFWTEHPRLPPVPIRTWQIWNEPNFPYYWAKQPFAPSYVALVHAAHDAIKRLDRGAKIVLAGLPNFSWNYVDQIYRVPGAKKYFDAVSLHPYTRYPTGVITILQRVRDVMNRRGDRGKSLVATETGFQGTSRQQSRSVQQLQSLLASHRGELHLMAFDYFRWVDPTDPSDAFRHYGLFHIVNGRYTAKAAYGAFRTGALRLEGCRAKARGVATRCAKRG